MSDQKNTKPINKCVLVDQKTKQEIELKDGITFGRSSKCNIVLKDADVSSRHMRIHIEDGQYFLIDLDSSNGTKINGKKITPMNKLLLIKNDFINIGKTTYLFYRQNNINNTSDATEPFAIVPNISIISKNHDISSSSSSPSIPSSPTCILINQIENKEDTIDNDHKNDNDQNNIEQIKLQDLQESLATKEKQEMQELQKTHESAEFKFSLEKTKSDVKIKKTNLKDETSMNSATDLEIGNYFNTEKKNHQQQSQLPLHVVLKNELHEQEHKMAKLNGLKNKLEFIINDKQSIIEKLKIKEIEYKRKNPDVITTDKYQLYLKEIEELNVAISKAVQKNTFLKAKIHEFEEASSILNEIKLLKDNIKKANHSEIELNQINQEIKNINEQCLDLQKKIYKEKQQFEKNKREEKENKKKKIEEEINKLKSELNKIA
ncbi:MAG: FHA domain-containing protein [Oligoflexia bacterium]|nr:FHA domain-containing protein [Oligoflexia bacterium]